MSLMIKSEISKEFFQEEDALKGFKTAVENNQVRLAMQILTEIVDAFAEGFDVIFSESEDQTDEPKVEEQKQPEKKTSNKKSETKEQTVKTEQQ